MALKNWLYVPTAVALLIGGCAADDETRLGGSGDRDAGSTEDAGGDSDESGDDSGGSLSAILPDCSSCPGEGYSLEALRCAVDLCDPAVFRGQDYGSPNNTTIEGTYAAVARFGDTDNDLEPLFPETNGSYALLATGDMVSPGHEDRLGGELAADPVTGADEMRDAVEWRLKLTAPADAHGFEINYVFFSAEYDEFVGSLFNDKFYILIEAESTNNGQPTVINFTECRDPDVYHDFVCEADNPACSVGTRACYLAINTALSECCWRDGCPDGAAQTDIAGTGYSCGNQSNDQFSTQGASHGSSTGWLATQWVLEPGEEFEVVFHLHDTYDQIYDSTVIVDKFVFLTDATPGTRPI